MPASTDTLFAPALAAWNFWLKMAETTRASGSVLGRRGTIIDHAMRYPFDADTRELSRIMPEKIAAFSKSGASLSKDWLHIQRLSFEQIADGVAIGSRGTPPTLADYQRTGARAITIWGLMSQAAIRALAPIHASVTANEKRLG